MTNVENKYEAEAKQRFAQTEAYKEYTEKTENYSKDKWQDINDGLMTVFTNFAQCMNSGYTVHSDKAKSLVKELQDYITENYYTCTNQILSGLGQMYIADDRFKNNLDKTAPGTAQFVSEAIKEYCK